MGVAFSIDGALVAHVFFVMPGVAGTDLLKIDVLTVKNEFAELPFYLSRLLVSIVTVR